MQEVGNMGKKNPRKDKATVARPGRAEIQHLRKSVRENLDASEERLKRSHEIVSQSKDIVERAKQALDDAKTLRTEVAEDRKKRVQNKGWSGDGHRRG